MKDIINTKLDKLTTTKLVCKYYTTLLQIIKEVSSKLNYKTRGETIGKIEQQIKDKYKENSEDLLKVFEITKKLIIKNYQSFTSGKKDSVSKNLWSFYYQIWQELNNPNKNLKQITSLNNLVRWGYNCWYSKLKFTSLIIYYQILNFCVNKWKTILWYVVFWLLISMWFIYYNNHNTVIQNKTSNKTILSTSKYFKKVWLTTWEINYLLKYNIIKNGKIIKYKNLSGTYIKYNNSNYNLTEFAKNNIISYVCMKEQTRYNTMFKKNKICFKYLGNVCDHKQYYINLINYNKNTKNTNIRKWLIYIKLLMKLWKCI